MFTVVKFPSRSRRRIVFFFYGKREHVCRFNNLFGTRFLRASCPSSACRKCALFTGVLYSVKQHTYITDTVQSSCANGQP